MRTVTIKPSNHPVFPWEVKTNGYDNFVISKEAAIGLVHGRFGHCRIRFMDTSKKKSPNT